MLLLNTESLWAGLVAAAPVRHPGRQELELVLPGVMLDDHIIHNLRRLGVPKVWVHWPSLDFLDQIVRSRVDDLREDVYQSLKADFENCQSKIVGMQHYIKYRNLVSRLILELLTGGRVGFGAQIGGLFDGNSESFSHAANVTYLSLTLGLRLQTYVAKERKHTPENLAKDLTNLGVGAMLHDLGKQEEPGQPSPHEPVENPPRDYQMHVLRGHKLIKDRVSPTVRAVVLHHHQRFDGKGFPDMTSNHGGRHRGPMKGHAIHIFPRIVHLIDIFEHLCYDGSGQPRPTAAALHDLLKGDLQPRFDPTVLRGLMMHVPPFPLGSVVTLSDGARAAVISLNRQKPCRPIVRLLQAAGDQPKDIDLSEQTGLHVRESLGFNVEKWLFELPPAFVRPAAWAAYAAVAGKK